MKKYTAFSLAEALITLLIVCIIAIASAPLITKKARKNPKEMLWIADTHVKTAVTPAGQYDIRLGDDSGRKKQGIVVVGTMYFKDKDGKIIGWIAEDGSTSFAQGNEYDFNAMSQKQEKLLQMVESLMVMLQNEKGRSSANSRLNISRSGSTSTDSNGSSSKRQVNLGRGGQKNTMIRVPSQRDRRSQESSVNVEDLQNMDESQLQEQLNSLMEMLNTQK